MMAPTWAVADLPTWTPAAKQGPTSMFEQHVEPEIGFAALMDAAPVAERTNSTNASALQRTESVDKAVVCIVPGCAKDLHTAKQYYQQHRICEEHFKSSSFELGGILCRFCQQCARSHPLPEFDGLLRSCKEQLRKHRMRRKSRKSDTMDETEPAKKVSCGSAREGDPVMFRLGIDGRRCSSGEIAYSHANLAGNYYDDWPHAHSPQHLHMDGQAPPLNEWNLHTSLSGGSSGSYVHLSPRWTQQQLQHQQQHHPQLGYDSSLGGFRPQHGQARHDGGGGPSRLNSEHRTFVTPNGRVHRHNSCSPLFSSNSSTSMLLSQQPPLQGVLSGGHATLRSQDEIAMCHDRWSVPEYLMHNNSLPVQQQAAPIFEQQQQRASAFDQQQQQPQQWKRQVQSSSYPRESELQSSPFSYDMYMAAMQDGGDREVTTSVVTTGIVTTAHPHSSGAAALQQRIVSLPQLSVNTRHLSQPWSPQQHSPQEASQHQDHVFDEHVPEGSFRQGSPQGSLQQQHHTYEFQHQACPPQTQPAYLQPQPAFDRLGRRPSNNESMDSRYAPNNALIDSHMYEQQQQQQQHNSFQQDWQDPQYLELQHRPPHQPPIQTFATEQCPLDNSTDKDSDLAHAVLQWLPLTTQPEPQPRQLPSNTFTFNTSLGTPTGSGELSSLSLAQTTSSSHWRPPTVEIGGREKGHIFYRQQLQLSNSAERALRWGHSTSQSERTPADAETTPALHSMPHEQQQQYKLQLLQQQEEGGELWTQPSQGQQASDCSHSTGTGIQPGSQPALGRTGLAVGSYHAMNSSINSRPVMAHSVFDSMDGGSRRDSDTPPNSGAWHCPIPKKVS